MNLTPSNLNDYIGQERVKQNIRICLEAGKRRSFKRPLGHMLLCGPPGLGKTSLSEIIATELFRPIKKFLGSRLKDVRDLRFLNSVTYGEVIFIDEIHSLPKKVEEALYDPMDRFVWNNCIIKPFTLIGATTKEGMLSKPLHNRFTIIETLSTYNIKELTQIIQQSAVRLNLKIDNQAASLVASRSRGTPRTANQMLVRLSYYSENITPNIARNALDSIGIDRYGCDHLDRLILKTLRDKFSGGPTGIESLSNVMGEDRVTIETSREPYLISAGLLERTGRGRCLTKKGLNHLQSYRE